MEDGCKVCGSHDEEEGAGCEEGIATNGSTSCSCPDNTKPGKDADRHNNKPLNLYFHVDSFLRTTKKNFQIWSRTAMAVTVDTLQVWRAVKQDHGKALTLPAQRESVTMMKQVQQE